MVTFAMELNLNVYETGNGRRGPDLIELANLPSAEIRGNEVRLVLTHENMLRAKSRATIGFSTHTVRIVANPMTLPQSGCGF
jgi:hypothetical protein